MTDNKALAEHIRNYLESGVDLLLTDDDCRAIIKALEQQPCEEYKRGWRDAIVTALEETHDYYTEDGVFSAIQEETLIGVGMLQEPKTGHWIDGEIESDNCKLPIQICSECNTFYPLSYTGGGHNYCPNCGAKMESEGMK